MIAFRYMKHVVIDDSNNRTAAAAIRIIKRLEQVREVPTAATDSLIEHVKYNCIRVTDIERSGERTTVRHTNGAMCNIPDEYVHYCC